MKAYNLIVWDKSSGPVIMQGERQWGRAVTIANRLRRRGFCVLVVPSTQAESYLRKAELCKTNGVAT